MTLDLYGVEAFLIYFGDIFRDTLLQQNITTTESEIQTRAEETAERLSGEKALRGLLEEYRPPKRQKDQKSPERARAFPDLDGQKRTMLLSSYEMLKELDAKVIELEEQIRTENQARQDAMKAINRQLAEIKKQVMDSDKKVSELSIEFHAIQKMIAAIKKFFTSFQSNYIKVAEEEASDFFDAHFNMPTIIEKEVSTTINLDFTPPEYYDVHKDMEVQRQQLNGLELSVENGVGETVENAIKLVTQEAATVQLRENINALVEDVALEAEKQTDIVVAAKKYPNTFFGVVHVEKEEDGGLDKDVAEPLSKPSEAQKDLIYTFKKEMQTEQEASIKHQGSPLKKMSKLAGYKCSST